MDLGQRTAALKERLAAKPGAVAAAMTPPRGSSPNILIFKVIGKMFAILSIRGAELIILKCDEHLVDILLEQCAGVGHRSHLDRRYWISVALDADVSEAEIERLADQSYDLVRAGPTRKQRAEL